MTDKNQKYPKQPTNPDRKPSESVTWVRNLDKVDKRRVVVVKKPAYTPRPK
jgi:hypothetical protein